MLWAADPRLALSQRASDLPRPDHFVAACFGSRPPAFLAEGLSPNFPGVEHSAPLDEREWGQAERNILEAVLRSCGSDLFVDEEDGLMGARGAGYDANQHLIVTATNAFLSAIQEPHPNSPS